MDQKTKHQAIYEQHEKQLAEARELIMQKMGASSGENLLAVTEALKIVIETERAVAIQLDNYNSTG